MKRIDVTEMALSAYEAVCGKDIIEQIRETAGSLRGLQVIHVNATPIGGGVAEILRGLIPLLTDQGLDASWHVIEGPDEFFRVTKRLHNQLQGEPGELTCSEREAYLKASEENYKEMEQLKPDLWVIHDPQPLAAGASLDSGACKVWRSHIDTSTPNASAWAFLLPFLPPYDASIYSHVRYAPQSENWWHPIHIVAPAIDPLSRKNRQHPLAVARSRLARLGIDVARPLVTQVARFDKWKDPLGVIHAYRLAREECAGLQLALAGC